MDDLLREFLTEAMPWNCWNIPPSPPRTPAPMPILPTEGHWYAFRATVLPATPWDEAIPWAS